MDAVALLQEWIVEVGSAAGLTPQNTFLATGSVGAPESTLEVRGGGGRPTAGMGSSSLLLPCPDACACTCNSPLILFRT